MSNPNDQSSLNVFRVGVQAFFADRPNLKAFRWTQYEPVGCMEGVCLIEVEAFTPTNQDGTKPHFVMGSDVEDFLVEFGVKELLYIFGEGATVTITREEIVVENPNEEVFD